MAVDENYSSHQRNCIIIMKAVSVLSMVSSYFITRDVLIRFHSGERIRLTHKIVFELSVANFWGSFFGPFLSTWMVPPDPVEVYGAAGTTATCTAQGFLENFFYGLGVAMNAILAITYCTIVTLGRPDSTRNRREFWLILGLPPLLTFFLACKPLFDQAYNYTGLSVCSIGEYPLGCLNSDQVECTRGDNAKYLKIARFSLVCLANLVIVLGMGILVRHLIKQEKRFRNAAANARNTLLGPLASQATWQGIWYVAAFMLCWLPWYIWQWVRVTNNMVTAADVDSEMLIYAISFTQPTQGFANALVFFRPRYLKFRSRDEDDFRIASILRVLNLRVPSVLDAEWWQSSQNVEKSRTDSESVDESIKSTTLLRVDAR